MDIKAKTKFARLSPTKGRDITRSITGLPVADALKITEFSARKAAFLVGKTLKSAIANAQNNAELSVDDLIVKQAVIEQGPTMKRYWPRARGGASPILKRMSHIVIVLTDGKEEGA